HTITCSQRSGSRCQCTQIFPGRSRHRNASEGEGVVAGSGTAGNLQANSYVDLRLGFTQSQGRGGSGGAAEAVKRRIGSFNAPLIGQVTTARASCAQRDGTGTRKGGIRRRCTDVCNHRILIAATVGNVNTAMEAFIGIVVATPLTIDDVTTTARRKRTAGMEQGSTFIRRYSRVGIRTAVAVGKVTERLLFKIIPRKGTTNLILEVGFGNPVNKLFCVIEVRTPGNIPGNIQWAGRY